MKNIPSLIIVFLSCFVLTAQSKDTSIEITYVKAYKNAKDKSEGAPKIIKDLEYKLICNTNEARFEYIERLDIELNKSNKRFLIRGGGRGVYYKNLKKQSKIWQIESFDDKTYLVSEKYNEPKWELLKETKKILGYDCFKAVGSYQEYDSRKGKHKTLYVEAWYAPSLSLPFGPAGFDGLPGIVLESYKSSFYFIASEIKIDNKNETIKAPSKGIELTKDDFLKKMGEYMAKVFPRKKK